MPFNFEGQIEGGRGLETEVDGELETERERRMLETEVEGELETEREEARDRGRRTEVEGEIENRERDR